MTGHRRLEATAASGSRRHASSIPTCGAEQLPSSMTHYPVSLVVGGKRCLVVGGGDIACRKVTGLLAARARVHVVGEPIGVALRLLDDVSVEERPYRPGEAADYRLVFAATGDHGLNAEVFHDAEAAGVWVNSADDPTASSFLLPAIARRGSLSVAVSSGGASPVVCAWLRDRLARELHPEHQALCEVVAACRRELHEAGCSTEGLDWRSAFESGVLDMLRDGEVDLARERLRTCLRR